MELDKKGDGRIALMEAQEQIEELARKNGLDFFEILFHLTDAKSIYTYGAYGIPGRFSHWTHGKTYHQLKTMYDYGLSKIYELVINTDPSHAFLLESNRLLTNKLVIAHVCGHVDFFKHSIAFKNTDRKAVDTFSRHKERIDRYKFDYGPKVVELFLDKVLSLQQNVDSAKPERLPIDEYRKQGAEAYIQRHKTPQVYTDEYDDLLAGNRSDDKPRAVSNRAPFPAEKERDLLYIIAGASPVLEDWQRDIILMVRNEILYFLPQMKTKIMNEGWASLWHSRLMRQLDLSNDEYVQFSQMHSNVLSPGRRQINPYYVGFKILEDIDRRFRGEPVLDEHGGTVKEYNWLGEELNPKRHEGNPNYELFAVRENTTSDAAFLHEFLTPQLIKDLDLYMYKLHYSPQEGDQWIIDSKDPRVVRNTLYNKLINFNEPIVNVAEGGAEYNGGELYLINDWDNDIDINLAKATLRAAQSLWGRTVRLETLEGNTSKRMLLTCTDADPSKEVSVIYF